MKTNGVIDLTNTVTLQDMRVITGKSEMTILNWRKHKGLDRHVITLKANVRTFVRFNLAGVVKWAKKREIELPGLADWEAKQKKQKVRVRI